MGAQQSSFAVARGAGAPFSLEWGNVPDPGPGEVLVRVVGVGLCHTDLIVRDQLAPFPLPAILGHEGAGVVEKLGAGVTGIAAGDHVVLTFDSCGTCSSCARDEPAYCREFYGRNFIGHGVEGCGAIHDADGQALHRHFFGQSSFAQYALAAERSVVPIDRDVPLQIMGPLGCGVQTGAGAVLNALNVRPGTSLAIFGAGSVGLSALLAAKVAQCGQIILVDRSPERLELGLSLGATSAIDVRDRDPVEAIRTLTGGGADYTLECTGVPAVLRQAVDALGVPGICGVVGAPPFGSEVVLDITGIVSGRTVRGIIEGDSNPRQFIPRLVSLWKAGQFPFDRLVTEFPLSQINDAVDAVHAGTVLKAVLRP